MPGRRDPARRADWQARTGTSVPACRRSGRLRPMHRTPSPRRHGALAGLLLAMLARWAGNPGPAAAQEGSAATTSAIEGATPSGAYG